MGKACKECEPKKKKVRSSATGKRTPLMKAARDGHAMCVDALIKNGANVNAFDENFSTALIRAADKGRVECLNLLLKAGANFNVSNMFGINALMSAVYGGHVECVDALLRAGVSVKAPRKRGPPIIPIYSPLHIATTVGEPQVLDLLINAGTSVNNPDNDGLPPLMIAAKGTLASHFECMKRLVHAGADVNFNRSHNYLTQTPLIGAVLNEKKLEFLINAGCDVDVTGPDGKSALMTAAARRKVSCCQLLLNAGANVNALDNFESNTPLIYAATGSLEFLCFGLRHPFHLNVTAPGTTECLKLLLSAGADVNQANKRGKTALHAAAFGTNVQCLKLLIEAGADVNANDETPMASLQQVITEVIYSKDKTPIPPPRYTRPKPKQTEQLAKDALKCLRMLLKAGAPINELWSPDDDWCASDIKREEYKAIFLSEIKPDDNKPSLFQEYFKLLQAVGELQGNIPPDEHEILSLKDICKDTIRNHLIDLDPHTNLISRIPELRLPSYLQSFLLNDVSLDITEAEEEKPEKVEGSDKGGINMFILIPWIGANEGDDDDYDDGEDEDNDNTDWNCLNYKQLTKNLNSKCFSNRTGMTNWSASLFPKLISLIEAIGKEVCSCQCHNPCSNDFQMLNCGKMWKVY